MPPRKPRRQTSRPAPQRLSKVLGVQMTAQLLTVLPDTVYDLFKSGELSGREVGRKWLTTRAAVLRWIESSSEEHSLTHAIEQGDRRAIAKTLNSGKIQVKKCA